MPQPLYSLDCRQRLSEKGYEQRSKRDLGWYTQGEMDRNAPFLAARGTTLQAPPRLFGQFHKVCSRKLGRAQDMKEGAGAVQLRLLEHFIRFPLFP